MIADALHRRLGAAGYAFSTVVFSQDRKIGLSFLVHELVRTPDVAIAIYSTKPVRKCLREAGVKSVFIYGDEPAKEEGRWIRFSAEEAIGNFVQHCVRTGVKRVLQVRFEGNDTPDAKEALAEKGIKSGWLAVPRMDELGRYEGIERAAYNAFMDLSRSAFPDVVLFWDDFVAQGALTAFLARGLKIPHDVKVVTLSNRGLCPVYSEALTRFECDATETGEKVAAYALSLLAKGRLTALQFDVLFTDGLYFRLGENGVRRAMQVRDLFRAHGYEMFLDSPTNQQFVVLDAAQKERISRHAAFDTWENLPDGRTVVRFATSWATTQEQVDSLAEALRG
jgi:DNA-binding LacI/PurR family transcriptional regulator